MDLWKELEICIQGVLANWSENSRLPNYRSFDPISMKFGRLATPLFHLRVCNQNHWEKRIFIWTCIENTKHMEFENVLHFIWFYEKHSFRPILIHLWHTSSAIFMETQWLSESWLDYSLWSRKLLLFFVLVL